MTSRPVERVGRRDGRRRSARPRALALLVCAGLASSAAAARVQTTPADRRCLRALDQGFARVAQARAARSRACLAGAATATLDGTLADCLATASDRRTRHAARKATASSARACVVAPPFGATDAATIVEAATARELLLAYDLFGGTVDAAVAVGTEDAAAVTCPRAVLRAAQRCQSARYREFAACKRRGLRGGGIADADGLAACMDVDPRGRIAKACDAKLRRTIARRCAGVDVATAFPGCRLADAGAVGGCLAEAIACGVCLALDRAGGLGRDCDLADDGRANASCRACPPAWPLPDGSALHADLVGHISFGVRRTGTAGAAASAALLADELGRLGFAVEQQPFPFERFDWDQAASILAVDGVSYDFVPVWLPAPGTVSATLAFGEGVAGKIALVSIAERILTVGSPAHLAIRAAIDAGAAAVVAINRYRPEAVALNVYEPFNETAWPVPVVIVGERDGAALRASVGKPATVSIAGTAGPSTAVNVIARWTPSPGAPTFVVSTPYTGWFTTAGERGPGLALFLGLARWVEARRSGANYDFVAIAGMELGTLGERAFLDAANHPPPPDAVAAWLHLGAGIVTWGVERDGPGWVRTAPEYGVSIATPGPLASAVACGLEDAGPFLAVPPVLAGGSLEAVFAAGYDAFGLQGTNDLYHTAEDVLGRNEPDAALLQPVAVGLVRALAALGG